MTKVVSVMHSTGFAVVAALVSLVMSAEYLRLIVAGNDALRPKAVLAVWLVIFVTWTVVSIRRIRARRLSPTRRRGPSSR